MNVPLLRLHELLRNSRGSPETLDQSYLRLLNIGQHVENLSFTFVMNFVMNQFSSQEM